MFLPELELLDFRKIKFGKLSEVDPGFIYLSDLDGAYKCEKHKITHVISLMSANELPIFKNVKHLRIPVEDTVKQNMVQAITTSLRFIRSARLTNGTVLIHCRAGVSRSATVALAYLMTQYRWKLEYALQYLKQRRPIIRPNPGFIQQLKCIEATLFTEKDEE